MTQRLRLREENRRWWTLGAMCFALFMVMLDNTAVNVALPSIQRDLDATISGLEWTVNAYTLTFAVLLVTGGRLGDLYGRKRIFLSGVVLFALSSGFIGFAQSDAWLVTGRAIQGIGAAMMMPGTLSIISNTFPPEERGKAIGTWAGVSGLALAIGPLIGGFLVENVSWQSIFFVNLPVAALCVVVTLFATRESRDETVRASIDIPGVVTITAALAALVLALVEANTWGWSSAQVIGLLAFSVIGFAAFGVVERRVPTPMVDFSFFRSRSFLGANLVAFTVTFGMLATFFFLTLYMQNILEFSPLEAGVRFLPTTLIIIAMGPIAGRLTDKIGPRIPLTVGLLLVAVSMFWQSRIDVHTSYGFLVGAFIVLGLGIGFVMSPMSTAGMNAVAREKAGVASGVLTMSRMVGGTFGVAVMGALVTTVGRSKIDELLPNTSDSLRDRLTEGLGAGAVPGGATARVAGAVREAFVSALSTGLVVATCFSLVAAVFAWALVGRVGRPRASAEPADEAVDAADPATPAERVAVVENA
jgi:EmrB/QacA subfamily drug resistance transporter